MNIINSGTASIGISKVFDEWQNSFNFDLEDLDIIKVFDPEFIIVETFLLTENSENILTETGEELIY